VTTHCLKTHPGPFQDVWLGIKKFEVRLDDRGIEVGHLLTLKEYHMHTGYTGRYIQRLVVIYKLSGGQFGIEKGFCVLGFDDVEAERLEDKQLHSSSENYRSLNAYEKAQLSHGEKP
jgi:hypothetical protein